MAPGSNNDTYSSCHRLLLESEVYFIYCAPDFSCSSMLRTHFSWFIQRWAKLGSSASHLPVQHPHMWRLQRCVLCAEHKKRSIQGHSQARCAQVRSRPMLKKYSVLIFRKCSRGLYTVCYKQFTAQALTSCDCTNSGACCHIIPLWG